MTPGAFSAFSATSGDLSPFSSPSKCCNPCTGPGAVTEREEGSRTNTSTARTTRANSGSSTFQERAIPGKASLLQTTIRSFPTARAYSTIPLGSRPHGALPLACSSSLRRFACGSLLSWPQKTRANMPLEDSSGTLNPHRDFSSFKPWTTLASNTEKSKSLKILNLFAVLIGIWIMAPRLVPVLIFLIQRKDDFGVLGESIKSNVLNRVRNGD